MARESERQPIWRPAEPRKQLRPPFAEGNEINRESRTLQQPRQMLRTRLFGARWVDGIKANEFPCQFDRRMHDLTEISIAYLFAARKLGWRAAGRHAPFR